jgi:adenylate cyclase
MASRVVESRNTRMTTTRRLAAIMAADVAGFSAAMERDEEGTFALVQELRRKIIEPKIAEHQGRLVKTTGDGFLAEFASPIAAMKCALAIQADLAGAPLQLRIGLNLGDVIVEESGDVYGEGVNVAARLEALADPSGILISAKVHSEVEGKVEASFEDRGEQQVKNIARPVRVYATRLPAAAAVSAALRDGTPLPLPNKPSIAVLPFQNMSGDPEQEYFADGMAEDITTALSHFKSLFVIARNSSFAYKGKTIDIKTVGRELGVRYVLEGSVRKAGDRIRITGQLVEAATGGHLWADKFDGSSQDVFELQDKVTSQVVGIIGPKIERVEIERAKRRSTQNLEAYDYYLKGIASYDELTRTANVEAIRLFSKAVEIAPGFASAISWLGYTYTQRLLQGWTVDAGKDTEEALRNARLALELTKEDAWVLSQSAYALVFFSAANELETALLLTERAVKLNPNNAFAWSASGWIQLLAGFPDIAIDHLFKSINLNPIDVQNYVSFDGLARAHFLLGRLDEARAWAEKSLTDNPSYLPSLRTMAAIEAVAGDLERARNIASRILLQHRDHATGRSTTARLMRNEEHRRKYVEALRLAGLPG